MAAMRCARVFLATIVGAAAVAPAYAEPVEDAGRIFVDSFETSPCDTNPGCLQFTNLGELSADTSGPLVSTTGTTEAWYRLRFTENNDTNTSLTGTITLNVPAGTDYDLYVYCQICGGALAGKSTNSGNTTEVVELKVEDEFLIDDAFDVLIEVRHISGLVCGQWTLQVLGDTSVGVSGNVCP